LFKIVFLRPIIHYNKISTPNIFIRTFHNQTFSRNKRIFHRAVLVPLVSLGTRGARKSFTSPCDPDDSIHS